MSHHLSEPGVQSFTLQEIHRQPALWPSTVDKVRSASHRTHLSESLREARVVLTGAGTSAYAATAIASAWPRAVAVPTTDILIDADRYLIDIGALILLTRSGNSPEILALVEDVRALRPDIVQIAIACDPNGAVCRSAVDRLIALDPRTNGRSLVPTIAFSNLVLAGLSLAQPGAIETAANECSTRASALLPEIERVCQHVAARPIKRVLVLSSSPLIGWAQQAGLMALEMTDCHLQVIIDTYLGLRHGLVSFLNPETLVLCLLSSDPLRRLYERGLIEEFRAARPGYWLGIAEPGEAQGLFDEVIPSVAPHADDALRTPWELLGPQLLGYYFSLHLGLDPDNPCSVPAASGLQGFRVIARP